MLFVEPTQSVEYVSYLQKHLNEFSVAFDEFMTMHNENGGAQGFGAGIVPAAFPKNGADPERIRALTDILDRLSGNLMELSAVTKHCNKRAGCRKD